MKKTIIVLAIIGGALLIIGGIVCAVVMSTFGFQFDNLSTSDAQLKSYDVAEDFENILIDADTADIALKASSDGKCRVECFETENLRYDVAVENKTLNIKNADSGSWIDNIGLFTQSKTLTVYLPKNEYAAVTIDTDTGDTDISESFRFQSFKLETDTGDVTLEQLLIGEMTLKTDTGDIELNSVKVDNASSAKTDTGKVILSELECKEFEASDNTGDVLLTGVTAADRLTAATKTGDVKLTGVRCSDLDVTDKTGSIHLTDVITVNTFSAQTETGSVIFEKCDGGSIVAKTNVGDIKGTLLSDKIFLVDASVGKADVPKTTSGGTCELTSSVGSIKIEIEK